MASFNSQGERVYPGHPQDAPADLEERAMDFARKTFDDIPCCRDAVYDVRWIDALPVLIVEFTQRRSADGVRMQKFATRIPAVAICLVKVNQGTLMQAYPGHELFRADALRRHLMTSMTDYLTKVGVGERLVVA